MTHEESYSEIKHEIEEHAALEFARGAAVIFAAIVDTAIVTKSRGYLYFTKDQAFELTLAVVKANMQGRKLWRRLPRKN